MAVLLTRCDMTLPFLRSLLGVALAVVISALPAPAQRKEKSVRPAPSGGGSSHENLSNSPKGLKGPAGPKVDRGRPLANPYTAVDRWNAMNPKQRQKLLAKMPPDRQKQFLEKVEKFNALPKDEQQLARERYDRLSKLPAEERQTVLGDIRRLNNLPPGRRQALNGEFLKLRQMSESERATYLASSEFKEKFYPTEQQIIGNLSKVLAARK